RQSRVHGIAERIEDRCDVLVDALRVHPYIGHRQREVLGERTRAVDADRFGIGAQLAPAREAVAASPADDVPLAAHDLPWKKIGDVRPYLDDLTDELVPDHQGYVDGLGRPSVPSVDVHIRPTDPGPVDANENVVDPDLRLRHVLERETRLGRSLYQGFH